jgi:hypothetical protein
MDWMEQATVLPSTRGGSEKKKKKTITYRRFLRVVRAAYSVLRSYMLHRCQYGKIYGVQGGHLRATIDWLSFHFVSDCTMLNHIIMSDAITYY